MCVFAEEALNEVGCEIADAVASHARPNETQLLNVLAAGDSRGSVTEIGKEGMELLMESLGELAAKGPTLVTCLREA